MKFVDLIEGKLITTYHGDNFGTTTLDPNLMDNGNTQEGIGIYFGDLNTAKSYGKDIISAQVNPKNYVNSRGSVGKELRKTNLRKLFYALHKIDNEVFYYDLTDWGAQIREIKDITRNDLNFLVDKLHDEQVRNLQMDLCSKFGVKDFVKIWNDSFPNVHGTFNKEFNYYAIINDKVQVEVLK